MTAGNGRIERPFYPYSILGSSNNLSTLFSGSFAPSFFLLAHPINKCQVVFFGWSSWCAQRCSAATSASTVAKLNELAAGSAGRRSRGWASLAALEGRGELCRRLGSRASRRLSLGRPAEHSLSWLISTDINGNKKGIKTKQDSNRN